MTRKTDRLVASLLSELEKHGIVMDACSKVGIGSSTYYRWRDEDDNFRHRAESAIAVGRRNITDLAESKLVQNIRNGNQRAIEFHLRGNDMRYMAQSRKELEEQIQISNHRVSGFGDDKYFKNGKVFLLEKHGGLLLFSDIDKKSIISTMRAFHEICSLYVDIVSMPSVITENISEISRIDLSSIHEYYQINYGPKDGKD